MNLRLAVVVGACLATCLSAQHLNPVHRINRTFYTSMWTANPPEYTTAGQTVVAGTMHWRVFREQTSQRAEPRQITAIGTWWQPSDPNGSFPQTINSLEYRLHPTTTDANGLVIPDVTQTPWLVVPPMPLVVNTGGQFFELTVSLGAPVPVPVTGDYALCAVYPANASSTQPGFFGLLPSGANQAYGLTQSNFGFAYPNGTVTHFGIGGARSSLWMTENQPTLSVRANWALSAAHYTAGYLGGAWGDSSYVSPVADPAWAGWSDGRSPALLETVVFADGMDGMWPLLLFNFGPRFPTGFPFAGLTLEVLPTDPLLTALTGAAGPIQGGRSVLSLPLLSVPNPALRGSYFGFEAVLVDPNLLQLVDSTQSVWVAN